MRRRADLLLTVAGVAAGALTFVVGRAWPGAAGAPPAAPPGMVYVPGGVTRIGDDDGAPAERPAFTERVQPFFLDAHLVTVAEFRRFVRETGHVTSAERFGDAGVYDAATDTWRLARGATWHHPLGPDSAAAPDDHPVTQVSWHDAAAYARWAGKRLPTEAEWEHAARGASDARARYAWGASLVADGRPRANTAHPDGWARTSPVGAFGRSSLGLADMGGNVWQWTADWYRAYADRAAPFAPDSTSERAQRGGSFLCDAGVCHGFRVSARSRSTPETALFHVGFRLARDVDPPDVPAPPDSARWWKGNTHTHTLWSDGDDFPEMVADWYKRRGYHFLAITDHNTLADAERWWTVPASGIGREAYTKYAARFGAWVEQRRAGDTLRVRLRRPAEYRPRLEEAGRFLLPSGEEITQYVARKAAHVNAINLATEIAAQPGASLVEIIRRDLAATRAQEGGGRDVVAVLNHPNFLWSLTAEELLALPELRFVEIYNGHPLVNVAGDALHASSERIWDVVLTRRAMAGDALLYGVATDDAHDYHRLAPAQRNAGRGWIVVRAPRLTGDALAAAMKRGDFYASTGVELTEVRRDGRRLSLAIRAEPGVTYTTQWIGTRRGHDTTSTAVHDSAGTPLTRRYSADVGAVLAESRGASATYSMRGDELYVRARIVSSRAAENPSYAGEVESAWTQPVRP